MKLRILFALVATCALIRAQDVPPPPKPPDVGPSLEATMKFIQEKLEAVGPVNFIAYVHDDKTGKEWTNDYRLLLSQVHADPSACRIDLHWYAKMDANVIVDKDVRFFLRAVRQVKVLPLAQDLDAKAAKGGHPEWVGRIEPAVFLLVAEQGDSSVELHVLDESMANRVAQAMVHAVELCGGGSKDPF